jgi:thymidylate kinase
MKPSTVKAGVRFGSMMKNFINDKTITMLDKIFEDQKNFQRQIGLQTDYISGEVKNRDLITHLVRAQDELNEAIRSIPFALGGLHKTASSHLFDKGPFTREIVDAFLFMINALNIAGVKSDDFLNQCQSKQSINLLRVQNKHRMTASKDCPLIIIDGPDGVGKSEICKSLASRLQLNMVRMAHPENMDNVEILSKNFNKTIDQIKEPLIMDRGYPSTVVYSEYFKRDSDLSYLTELFRDRDVFVFIILAKSPYRGDWFIDEKDFQPISDLYLKHAIANKWKIIHNNDRLEDCVNQIISALQF